MSRPTTQVLVYFTDTATASSRFTLDDAVRGELDSVYTLSGDTGTDVATDASQVTIRRGRESQIFENIDPSQCSVLLNNEERTYDPMYNAGPWYGNIRPGKRMQVITEGVVLWEGKAADWDLAYSTSGRSTAMLKGEDALATLGRASFDEFTATASQTAGTRLDAVISRSEVAWSGGARDFDTGISTLQGDSVSWGSNVLNYCQLVARSDLGAFFASRNNLLTFRDRHANITSAPVVAFADGGTGVEFQGVGVQFGSETFYQRVSVDRAGGVVQSYTTTSADDDGIRTLTLAGLLLDSDDTALEMAQYLATVYSTGEARVSEISVVLDDSLHTADELAAMLAVELNDVVSITWTPNGVGDPIEQTLVVEGITHRISVDRHDLILSLGKRDGRAPFLLDSATNGLLDGAGVLTF